jgi:hypothetical protein
VTDVTNEQGQDDTELTAADEQLLREFTERACTGGAEPHWRGRLLGRLTKMMSKTPWKAGSMTILSA